MGKNKRKIISGLVVIISVLCIGSCVYAHSGRTDANGGHRDNKNKSGLGSYHYHCGGYGAHLHPNGVCPYSDSASSSSSTSSSSSNNSGSASSSSSNNNSSTSNSTSSKSTSSAEEEKTTPTTILASDIKIAEGNINIKIGENKQLTANITPDNTTEKDIIWKSSDESILTIDELGKISSISKGKAIVTASTSNGKTDTVTINVEEKENVNNVIKTLNTQMSTDYENDDNSNGADAVLGLATLGAMGGAGYWVYKKCKK